MIVMIIVYCDISRIRSHYIMITIGIYIYIYIYIRISIPIGIRIRKGTEGSSGGYVI